MLDIAATVWVLGWIVFGVWQLWKFRREINQD